MAEIVDKKEKEDRMISEQVFTFLRQRKRSFACFVHLDDGDPKLLLNFHGHYGIVEPSSLHFDVYVQDD